MSVSNVFIGTQPGVQWEEYFPSVNKVLSSFPAPHNLGMELHAYNPSIKEVEAERSEVQNHP